MEFLNQKNGNICGMSRFATMLLILFCCTVLNACKEKISDKNVQENQTQYAQTTDSATLQTIKKIGDLVYDFPQQFLQHQDSISKKVNEIEISSNTEAQAYQLLLLNIGYVLRQDGQILNAINTYEKALALYYKSADKDIDFAEYYVKPLGSLYTMIGDLQKAANLQNMAIAKEANDENKSALMANLAITIQQLHDYDSAISLSKKGIEYTDANTATALRHYNELASCYMEKENWDSAASYNDMAIATIAEINTTQENSDFYVWASTAFATKGQLAYAKNDFARAERQISKALKLLYLHLPHTYLREKAKLQTMKAKLLLQAKDYGQAIIIFHKAINLINSKGTRLFPDNTITDSYSGLAKCYENMAKNDSAISYYSLAVENDYVVQQFIATKESSYFNSSQSRSLLVKLSELLYSQYQKSTAAADKNKLGLQLLWATELSKGRQLINELNRSSERNTNDSLSAEIWQTQTQLRYLYQSLAFEKDANKKKKISSDISSLVYKTSLSENIFAQQYSIPDYAHFVKTIEHASRNADVLSWQMNNDAASYCISVSDGAAAVQALDSSTNLKNTIATFLNQYFYQGPEAFNNDPSAYFETSNKILKTLIPKLANCRKPKWILSKDGFSYSIPFDALAIGPKHFLIEEKSLHAEYSLLQLQPAAAFTKDPLTVNIFANTQAAPGFPALKHIYEEVANIKKEINSTVFWDKETDFNQLQQSLNSPNILHISAHAIADSTQSPYLVLEEKISLDKLDYVLTQSPLVVLSACETAKGEAIVGEGVESMNKAFLSKGIKGVIAAQWTVDDAFLPSFMQRFYSELKYVKNPELALRNAKIEFIKNNSNTALANPWEWASLTYTGAEMQLELQPSYNNLWKWIASVGTLLIGLLLFWVWRKRKNRKPSKKIASA